MDFLSTFLRISKAYHHTAPVLNQLLDSVKHRKLVVLGAGNGGGILDILQELPSESEVVLTDLFPDSDFQCDDSRVRYYDGSVDAFSVPSGLDGVRVMYTTFHHFRPKEARRLIEDAVNKGQPIAIFEASERTPLGLICAMMIPFVVVLLMPFSKPFRLRHFIWTYAIPIVPLGALWDGIVSTLRTYSIEEAREMVRDFSDYDWETRLLEGGSPLRVFSMVGKPMRST